MRISIFALVLASLVTVVPAYGSPETDCNAEGGTYYKDGPVAVCEFPVGSSDNVKTTDQKGSFNSSHTETKTNPGGNQPPGQQGGNDIGK